MIDELRCLWASGSYSIGSARFDFGGMTGKCHVFEVVADRVGSVVTEELDGVRFAELHQRIVAFDFGRLAAGHVEGERPAFGVASCIRPDAGGTTHVLEPLLSARGQAIPGNVARMGLL